MRRCPKCNRTFETDTQKFCTHDGGLLFAIDAGLSETVQLDSTKIRDAVAKPTTRDLDAKLPAQFDPEATVITPAGDPEATMISSAGRDDVTVQGKVRDTGELAPQVTQHHITPPAAGTSGPIPPTPAPPTSGPIAPPHTSAPLAPAQLPTAGPVGTSAPVAPAQPPTAGPVGTSAPLPAQQVAPQQPSQPLAAPPKKKSKLPLILGILAVLFVLGIGVVIAAYLVFARLRPANRPTEPVVASEPGRTNSAPSTAPAEAANAAENEPAPYVPPPDAVQFVNSKENLAGKLVENFVDFSFYYPDRWVKVPSNDNFITVERRLPPDFTQENFAAAPWYSTDASATPDNAFFQKLAEKDNLDFSKKFPEYRKISEGPTKVGIYDAYEFRFEAVSRGTDKGDVTLWGREIFFPPRPGEKTGLKFLILTTSLAPELKSAEDVGQKGELPMLLESFRFGKK